ncbi:hypothetical protein G6O67_003249 [Ophiocordyceps sinensis]|uniref:Uncharacterized protein n=2 Tax=Ophiocordyceps sinensis TaxID=72228 RepID=A0A8H4PVU3_9HYPO|nr:hypothetical protein G6O67_003249 [Ophiocordyceps sinensis]
MNRSSNSRSQGELGTSLSSQSDDGNSQDEQHSICCAAHQCFSKQPADGAGQKEKREKQGHDSDCGELQCKMYHLCQRAEELHSSRKGLERLANASTEPERSTGASGDYSGETRAQCSNTLAAKHYDHSLDEDDEIPFIRRLEPDGLEKDLVTPIFSTSQPHAIDADDVFGPVRRFVSASSQVQGGQDEANGETESTKSVESPRRTSASVDLDTGARHGLARRRSNAESTDSRETDVFLSCSPGHHGNESPGPSASDLDKVRDEGRYQKPRSRSHNLEGRGYPATPTPFISIPNRTAQLLPPRSSSASVTDEDLSRMAENRPHRRGTNLCPPFQGADAKPDPWPRLRKVDESQAEKQRPTPGPVPWSRVSLRKMSSHADGPGRANETSTPSTWRQGLKKTAEGRKWPGSVTAPSTPASRWRQNLTETRAEMARPRLDKRANACVFCDPTSTTPPQDCNHQKATSGGSHAAESRAESSVTRATLRVRQVERSLAQKKAEEELEASMRAGEASQTPWGGPASPEDGEAQVGWENARDCSSPECRGCLWRDRYMDLRGEMEKWKTELNSCDADEALGGGRPSQRDKGVEDGVAQQGTPDDVDMEGLTIVVHMRHRDDLVITTDLRGASWSGTRGQGRRD